MPSHSHAKLVLRVDKTVAQWSSTSKGPQNINRYIKYVVLKIYWREEETREKRSKKVPYEEEGAIIKSAENTALDQYLLM